MNLHMDGKVALITGVSRERGIGAAIAEALARAGATIFTTYYRPFDATTAWGSADQEPEAILAELRAHGIAAAGVEADLADPSAPAQIIAAANQAFGHVDILINNAAYYQAATLEALTGALLDQHYAVNVRGTLLLCQAFADQHDGRAGGRIINLTSGQGVTAMPAELPYVTTKAAIEGLTLTLSAALASKRITVNAVDPGATDTGWISEHLHAELVGQAPFGRIGLPDDAARLIGFLVSDEGQWITGQIIRSRGGA
ncbi:MAG TPA: SDR family oxidoreductase [Roseiflexaceae bacterium]|nr:SDR family oxidoreductase [Roseiflexaceae bacterium]